MSCSCPAAPVYWSGSFVDSFPFLLVLAVLLLLWYYARQLDNDDDLFEDFLLAPHRRTVVRRHGRPSGRLATWLVRVGW